MKEIEDQDLSTGTQLTIRKAVQSLPDEVVNMAWRSELNEKLRVSRVPAAPYKKKFAFKWIFAPAAGLAVAGALFFLTLAPTLSNFNAAPATKLMTQNSIESALANEIESGIYGSDYLAAGLTNFDSANAPIDLTTVGESFEYESL